MEFPESSKIAGLESGKKNGKSFSRFSMNLKSFKRCLHVRYKKKTVGIQTTSDLLKNFYCLNYLVYCNNAKAITIFLFKQ